MLSFSKLYKASRSDSLSDERGEMKGQTETQLLGQLFLQKQGHVGAGLGLPSPSDSSLTGCLLSTRHMPTLRPPRGWSSGGGFPVLCGSQVFKNM